MSTLNGSSLFSGITSGLTSTYSILANASSSGVTETSIASTMSNSAYASKLNSTFSSYILSNFSSLDKNKDGTLNSAEVSSVGNMISSAGLTSAQLNQLGAASGLSTDALNQVLSHFADIDVNHDGKVTSAEINAYNITSAEEKKKIEFSNRAATNMSVFYGSDDASAADSSSLLDYKYSNNSGNSNSTNSNG